MSIIFIRYYNYNYTTYSVLIILSRFPSWCTTAERSKKKDMHSFTTKSDVYVVYLFFFFLSPRSLHSLPFCARHMINGGKRGLLAVYSVWKHTLTSQLNKNQQTGWPWQGLRYRWDRGNRGLGVIWNASIYNSWHALVAELTYKVASSF